MAVFKKIGALVVALCIFTGGISFASANENAAPSEVQVIVNKLSALGLWEGRDISADVTREEFAGLTARLLGLEQVKYSEGTPYFSDVKEDSQFYNQIEVLCQMGVIDKAADGKFLPSMPITFGEAVKMLVNALGYEAYAKAKGGYPTGYIMTAVQYGIISGGSVKPFNDNIKFADAALMINHAIDAQILKRKDYGKKEQYEVNKNATVLSEYLKIFVIKGVLEAVGDSRINEGQQLPDNNVEINGEIFGIGPAVPDELLGYNVKAYYKAENGHNDQSLLYIEENGSANNTLTVEYDNIKDCRQRQLFYWTDKEKSGSVRSQYLPESMTVIKNGSIVAYNDDYFKTADKIVLIDNNGDGGYDIARVDTADVFVVSNLGGKNYTVYDKYMKDPATGLSKTFDLAPDGTDKKVSMVDDQGNPCDISAVETWSVLTVYHDENYKKTRIVVTNRKITGMIQEISNTALGKTMTVNNVEYKISKNLTDKLLQGLKVGDNCNFYLDDKSRIAGFDIQNSLTQKYGFLVKAKLKNGIEDKAEFKMLIKKYEFSYFSSSSSMELDGEKGLDAGQVISKLKSYIDKSSPFYNKRVQGDLVYPLVPVRYNLNEQGELCLIDTPVRGANEDVGVDASNQLGNATMTKYSNFTGGMFIRNTNVFGGSANPVAVSSKTVVFVVPTVNSSDRWDDINYYTVTNLSYFVDFNGYPSPGATLEAYDVTKGRVAGCMVYRSDKGAGTVIGDDTPMTVVEKITNVMTEDGSIVQMLYGYQDNSEIRIPIAPGFNITKYYKGPNGEPVASTIRFGDIIRYGTDDKGQINSYDKIFSLTDEDDPSIVLRGNEIDSTAAADTHPSLLAVSTNKYSSNGHLTSIVWYGSSSDYNDSKFRVAFGRLLVKNGGNLVVEVKDSATQSHIELANATPYNLLAIDQESGKIYRPSIGELIAAEDSEADASNLIINTASGDNKAIILVKRAKQ